MDYSNFYNLLGTGTGFLGSTVLPFLNGLDGKNIGFKDTVDPNTGADVISPAQIPIIAANMGIPYNYETSYSKTGLPAGPQASQNTSKSTVAPTKATTATPAPPAITPHVTTPTAATPTAPVPANVTPERSQQAAPVISGNSIEDQLVRRWANELVRHQRYDNGKMDYQLGPKTISDLRYRAQRAMLDPTFASMAKANIGNPQLTREYAGQALRNVRHEAGMAKAMEPTVEEKARMQQSGMMRNPTAPAAINNPPTNQSRPAYSDAASRSTTTPGLMV